MCAFMPMPVVVAFTCPLNEHMSVLRRTPSWQREAKPELYTPVTDQEFMMWVAVFMLRMVGIDPAVAPLRSSIYCPAHA